MSTDNGTGTEINGSSCKSASKKARITTYQFTLEQETELAEWYRGNPCLYDKKLKSYKDAQAKKTLLQEKASMLQPPCSCK